jgi:hypothetical protein
MVPDTLLKDLVANSSQSQSTADRLKAAIDQYVDRNPVVTQSPVSEADEVDVEAASGQQESQEVSQKRKQDYLIFLNANFELDADVEDQACKLKIKPEKTQLLLGFSAEEKRVELKEKLGDYQVPLDSLLTMFDQYQFDGVHFTAPHSADAERNDVDCSTIFSRNLSAASYHAVNNIAALTIYAAFRIWDESLLLGANYQTYIIAAVVGSLLSALPYNNYYFAAIDQKKSPLTYDQDMEVEISKFIDALPTDERELDDEAREKIIELLLYPQARTNEVAALKAFVKDLPNSFLQAIMQGTPPSWRVMMSFTTKLIEAFVSLSFLFKGTFSFYEILFASLVLGSVDGLDMAVNKVLNQGEIKRRLDSFSRYFILPPLKSFHSALTVAKIADHPALVWLIATVAPSAWMYVKYSAMMRWAEIFTLPHLAAEAGTHLLPLVAGGVTMSIAYASFVFYEYNVKQIMSEEMVTLRLEELTYLAKTMLAEYRIAALGGMVATGGISFIALKFADVVTQNTNITHPIAGFVALLVSGYLTYAFRSNDKETRELAANRLAKILTFRCAKDVFEWFDNLHTTDLKAITVGAAGLAIFSNLLPNLFFGMGLLSYTSGALLFSTLTSLLLPERPSKEIHRELSIASYADVDRRHSVASFVEGEASPYVHVSSETWNRDCIRFSIGTATIFLAAGIGAIVELILPIVYQFAYPGEASPEEFTPGLSFGVFMALTFVLAAFASKDEYFASAVNRTDDSEYAASQAAEAMEEGRAVEFLNDNTKNVGEPVVYQAGKNLLACSSALIGSCTKALGQGQSPHGTVNSSGVSPMHPAV